jgi:AcrR family transcriptional regulator
MPRPTQNKHQEKSEATRRKLFKAALRVFSRDGFEAARIEDIAAEAGFTRGAFYAHFPAKEDLFFALLEDESRKHWDKMRRALEQSPTPEAKLCALREYYVHHAGDRAWIILILEFKLYAFRHPKLRARLAREYRNIRQRIKWESLEAVWPESVRCGPGRGEPEKLLLQGALSGLVLQRAYDPSSLTAKQLDSLLRSVFDFVSRT